MDGFHNDHASEGSRRHFLKTAAAAGGAAAVASADSVWARPARLDRAHGDAGQDRPEGARPGHGNELGPSAQLRPGRAPRRRPLHRHLRELRRRATARRPWARCSNAPRCARTSTWSPRTAAARSAAPRAFRHVREASRGEPGAAANRLHRLLLPPRCRGPRDPAAQRSRRQGGIRKAEESPARSSSAGCPATTAGCPRSSRPPPRAAGSTRS